jgi:ABC-type uncharacterized transport system permease subunit
VANQPTWGLDIGAVAYVHQQLLDAAAAGSAVLLISEDLDEVFALADRIAVMHHGHLSAACHGATGRCPPSAWPWPVRTSRPQRRGAMLRLELRIAPSRALLLGAPLLAIVFTLAISSLLVAWAGAPVGQAYALLLQGGFGSRFALTETLTRATPLIFTGLAAAVAFGRGCSTSAPRASSTWARWPRWRWAACTAAAASTLPLWLLLPLMMLAAALAGALLLLVPALLKSRYAVDEVVTTLLLNFIVLLLRGRHAGRAHEGPHGHGLAAERGPAGQAAAEPLAGTQPCAHRLVDGAGLRPALVGAAEVHHARLRDPRRGLGPARAAFAGMPVAWVTVKVALLSGALAGLAGAVEVAGRAGYVTLDMSPGYGYSGIVIAMLAALHPLAVVGAAVFVAGILVGADSMSRAVGVPTYIADVIVAVALIAMLVATMLTQYRCAGARSGE